MNASYQGIRRMMRLDRKLRRERDNWKAECERLRGIIYRAKNAYLFIDHRTACMEMIRVLNEAGEAIGPGDEQAHEIAGAAAGV